MPGTAKTKSFLLSSATVMLGAMDDLYNLNPAAHSIGLVKNFKCEATPGWVDLTQGIENVVVDSTMNKFDVACTCEVYEYSARNLAYAAGLDGSSVSFDPRTMYSVKTTITAAATAVDITSVADISGDFAVGDWIYLQQPASDVIHIAKISAVAFATATLTLTFAGYAIPSGVTFAAGSNVGLINRIDAGNTGAPELLAAKVVGVMPKGKIPVAILFPKVRITKGLSLAFQTDNYGNMPFEFMPQSLLGDDTFYADFGDNKPFSVFQTM